MVKDNLLRRLQAGKKPEEAEVVNHVDIGGGCGGGSVIFQDEGVISAIPANYCA